MPQSPDCQCKVINGKVGTSTSNTSWIIGRIVRDFEYWTDPATRQETARVLDERWKDLRRQDPAAKRPTRAGLVVSVYRPSTTVEAGVPSTDGVYWSGVATMLAQLAVAAIPWGRSGNWAIMLVTAAGTALSLLTGLQPQWRREKWACRTGSPDSYILTRGNGAQHVIVVLGNGRGLDLEDLATGQSTLDASANMLTRLSILVLTMLWILLLVTAAGLRSDTWYLLAVGGIGILQNVFAAGWSRRPETFGVPLDFVSVHGKTRVMNTLFEVEEAYPALGRSMRAEFFPGKLRADEIQRWDELERKAEAMGRPKGSGPLRIPRL
jgi:hypothetical protein